MSSRGWNMNGDLHSFSEAHPIVCPLSLWKSVLNVKPEFPVFRIVLVASCPSTFNKGQTAVRSPLPLLFPRLNHPSSLYLPHTSRALALTIMGALHWTRTVHQGLFSTGSPNPDPLCAVSLVLRIWAMGWNAMKRMDSPWNACMQFPVLQLLIRQIRTGERFISLISDSVAPLFLLAKQLWMPIDRVSLVKTLFCYLCTTDLEPEILSIQVWWEGHTLQQTVLCHISMK